MHNAVLARRLSIALLFSALTIAGCSNSGNPSYYQPPTNSTPTPPVVTPTPAPTSSAPVSAATVLYIANGTSGVGEYNALTGAAINASFAPPATGGTTVQVGVDDNGNVYQAINNGSNAAPTFEEVSSTGTVVASYTPSGSTPEFLGVAPTGEVVISSFTINSSTNAETDYYDAWSPGATGPSPTYTYTTSGNYEDIVFALDAAGNLYAPAFTTAQTYEVFDVGQPSGSTPNNTVTDTLASSNENSFTVSSMSVTTNGTLVVGEDAFASPDPDQGVYEYANALNSSTGAQTLVTSPSSVIALDTDASNNIYAALNNATFSSTSETYGADTEASIEEIAAGATTGSVIPGEAGVGALTAGTNGSVYLSQFGNSYFSNVTAPGNVYYLAPGSTTVSTTPLIADTATATMSLLYGSTAHNAYNGFHRKTFYASLGGSRSAHGSFARFNRRHHGMLLRRMTAR